MRVDPTGQDGETAEIEGGLVLRSGDARDAAVFDRDLLVAKYAPLAVDERRGLDDDRLRHGGDRQEQKKQRFHYRFSGSANT